jgi:hypothetical protein
MLFSSGYVTLMRGASLGLVYRRLGVRFAVRLVRNTRFEVDTEYTVRKNIRMRSKRRPF